MLSLIYRTSLLFFLLAFSVCSFALQYSPDFKNCSISKVSNNIWRAKFNLVITKCYGCDNSKINNFTVWVPKVNLSTGKPYIDPQNYASSPNFKNITIPNTVTPRINYGSLLIFEGSDDKNVIKGGGDISFDFSTKDNNGYPGIIMDFRNLTVNGGGTKSGIVTFYAGSDCDFSGNNVFPPIIDIDPPEPDFKLRSATWNLQEMDVSEIPSTSDTYGYKANIIDVNSNKFCINYVTDGVKKNMYAISVDNSTISSGKNQLLFMRSNLEQKVFYKFDLISDNGDSRKDLHFPSMSNNYISLDTTSPSVGGRSEMCWTPELYLFKDSSTGSGVYSDVLDFSISVKS